MRQKKSVIGFGIIVLAYTTYLVTIMSLFAGYINPKIWWPVSLAGLGFIVIYPLNFVWFFYYLFRKNKQVFSSIAILVIGWPLFLKYVNISKSNQAVQLTDSIRIMSFNARLFDLYNWSHNVETKKKIFDFLAQHPQDVYCFQEYYTENSGKFDNTTALKNKLNMRFVHTFFTTHTMGNTRHWGLAIFSKYPIVNTGVIDIGITTTNACTFADIVKGKDTIRIYNAHLESVRLKKQDYNYVDNIRKNVESNNFSGVTPILKRIKTAFTKRAVETDIIKQHLADCKLPIVFCGDFNDPPSSYTYNQITENLNDAFKSGPVGLGSTYNGVFPALRIDYILYSPLLKASNFVTHKVNLSDHFPVATTIHLNNE